MDELDELSWREFAALLAGLSPHSRLAAEMLARGRGRAPSYTTRDPQEAARLVRQLFGAAAAAKGGRVSGAQGR